MRREPPKLFNFCCCFKDAFSFFVVPSFEMFACRNSWRFLTPLEAWYDWLICCSFFEMAKPPHNMPCNLPKFAQSSEHCTFAPNSTFSVWAIFTFQQWFMPQTICYVSLIEAKKIHTIVFQEFQNLPLLIYFIELELF